MDLEFENNITKREARDHKHVNFKSECQSSSDVECPKTPSRKTVSTICEDVQKTPVNLVLQQTMTPRRSARKSIKPKQDYDEIVTSRHQEVAEYVEEKQTKWTPAKVGRVSQKRSTRKGQSGKKTKSKIVKAATEDSQVKEPVCAETLTQKLPQNVKNDNTPFEEKNISTEQNFFNNTFDKTESGGNTQNQSFTIKTATIDLAEMGLAPLDYDMESDAIEETCYTEEYLLEENKNIEEEREVIQDKVLVETVSEIESGEIKIDEKLKHTVSSNENQRYILNSNEKEEKINYQEKENLKDNEFDEMPSLILLDEEEDDVFEANKTHSLIKANDTFNASDCIIVSPPEKEVNKCTDMSVKNSVTSAINMDSPLLKAEKKAKDMQAKYFAPNKAGNQIVPKIVLIAEQNKVMDAVIDKTPKLLSKVVHNCTPGSLKASNKKSITTPISIKNKAKTAFRFPTPTKLKNEFNFNKSNKENVTQKFLLNPLSQTATSVTTFEPKEIVLRSIRKRSLSLTIDGERRNRKAQNVTFHSPANQTTTTENIDQMLAKSAHKLENTNKIQNNRLIPRKRSISLDENVTRLPSKLPRRVIDPIKTTKSPLKVPTRTKLPNFNAIHQKQFQKMENLVDYVARKTERAQNLTNSAIKLQNAQTIKSSHKENSRVARALPLQHEQQQDKYQQRQEHHIALFKGRSNPKNEVKRKTCERIRGVRSNRRFELLMQHRKTSGI